MFFYYLDISFSFYTIVELLFGSLGSVRVLVLLALGVATTVLDLALGAYGYVGLGTLFGEATSVLLIIYGVTD